MPACVHGCTHTRGPQLTSIAQTTLAPCIIIVRVAATCCCRLPRALHGTVDLLRPTAWVSMVRLPIALMLGLLSVPGVKPASSVTAPPAVAPGMKSIGVAVKASTMQRGIEKVVFEHTLSPGATHGVMTEAWHAGRASGTNPNLRVRYYIDGETSASVDYPLFLAHGTGPAQTNISKIGPWGNAIFGRTHDSGWYNVRPGHLVRENSRLTLPLYACGCLVW